MKAFGRSTLGLAMLVSGILILTTFILGILAFEVAHETTEKQLDHRIVAETRELLAEPGEGRLASIAAAIERRERAAGPNHLHYLLVDSQGQQLAGRLALAGAPRAGYDEFLSYNDGQVAQALTSKLPGGARLVVAADRNVVRETDRALLTLIASGFGILLFLGLGGAWTVGALTRTRLMRLDAAAQAIIRGDMASRMPVDGSKSEFDRLSHTLNRMLDRIEALMTNLRQVSSDVAHDLRVPLTRLRNHLAEASSAPASAKDAAIEAAAIQADELLDIFGALLRISEIEALGVRSQFGAVALSEELEDLVESYRPDAELGGRRLDATIAPGVVVLGDRRLLMQLVVNLLDNALVHTPTGTHVHVSLSGGENLIKLIVEDDGPGVPAEHLPRLFERFSRVDSSRASAGHGLGLALVAAIAAAHDGSASLRPGAGFAVEIRLPVS